MSKHEEKTTTTTELLEEEMELRDGGNDGVADASGGDTQEQDSPRTGPSARVNLPLIGAESNAMDDTADDAQSASNLPPAAAASVVATAFGNDPELTGGDSSPALSIVAIGTMAGIGNRGAGRQPNHASRPSLTSRSEIVQGANGRGIRSQPDFNLTWGAARPSAAVARATMGGDGGDNSATVRREGPAVMMGSIELGLDGLDEGPLPPVGMVEAMPNAANTVAAYRPNQDDGPDIFDDVAPHPPAATLDGSLWDVDTPKRTVASANMGKNDVARPQQVDEEVEPTPFDFAEFEDHCDDEKKPAARNDEDSAQGEQEDMHSGEDSIREPRIEEDEERNLFTLRGPADITRGFYNINPQLDIDGFVDGNGQADTTPAPAEDANGTNHADTIDVPNDEGGSTVSEHSTPAITQAYPVDENVIIATHMPPPEPALIWCKQKEMKRCFAILFVLSFVGAVALGVPLSMASFSESTTPTSQPTTDVPTDTPTTSPSTSIAPTALPSDKPSPSPSSSPTDCARQITSQAQMIDLRAEDLLELPSVAVDGRNMVAVVRDRGTFTTYTTFYTLRNDEWIIKNTFIEEYDDHDFSVVTLSGNTTFVGFPNANGREGAISVYEQNQFQDWAKVKEPSFNDAGSSHSYFGKSVYIDGDLGCVGSLSGIHLFRRESTGWGQFDMVDGRLCSIVGDVIAIASQNLILLYNYNADLDGVVLLPNSISARVRWMSLNRNYLTFLAEDDGIFIYHQELENQTFELHQHMNMSNLHPKQDLAGSTSKVFERKRKLDGDWELLPTLFPTESPTLEPTLSPTENLPFSSSTFEHKRVLQQTRFPTFSPTQFPTQLPTFSPNNLPTHSASFFPIHNPNAFDKDSLIIGGNNYTRVFSEQNGSWEEILILDQSYDEYHLSGRNLLGVNSAGVYSLNIERCLQLMPTQTPSVAPSPSPSTSTSLSPSQSPSSSQSPSESTQPSQSAVPSVAPTSISASPSVPPSSSLSPTETCFFVEVNVRTDRNYPDTWWDISLVVAVNGTREENVVYDSSTVKLWAGGETYRAAHVQRSAADISVEGALCECEVGSIRCNCEGQVCLIKRRSTSDIYLQVESCEKGGGVAAIIYDDVERPLFTPCCSHSIPAALISWVDGQHLVEHGLGEVVSMTSSASLQFSSEALHSRRVCLPEGDYNFAIYDNRGDGICCDRGEGHYNVTSNGGLIAQGAEFGRKEVTSFPLPFLPVPDEGI